MSDLDIILQELNIQTKNINLDDLYVQIEEIQNNNSQCVFKSVDKGAFKNIIQTIKSDNMEDDNISLYAKQMIRQLEDFCNTHLRDNRD